MLSAVRHRFRQSPKSSEALELEDGVQAIVCPTPDMGVRRAFRETIVKLRWVQCLKTSGQASSVVTREATVSPI